MPSPAPSLPSPLRLLIAGVGVALVLFLSVAAASPVVHAWLHDHGADEARACEHRQGHEVPTGAEEAGCAVTLFGHGTLPLLICRLPALPRPVAPVALIGLTEAFSAAHPRYRLVPSHAPPVG